MNYPAIQKDVASLIKEFGQVVTCKKYNLSTYDTTTGISTPIIKNKKRNGVVASIGDGKTLDPGTLIQNGDIRLLLDASSAVDPQDHYVVQNVEYTIISIKEISPAGIICYYDLHLRT